MIRARLHGEVNELTEVLMPADRLKRLVTHILRVARREADTHVRYGVCHELQKVGEVDDSCWLLAIGYWLIAV